MPNNKLEYNKIVNKFISKIIRFAKENGLFKPLKSKYDSINIIKDLGEFDAIVNNCLWEMYIFKETQEYNIIDAPIDIKINASALILEFCDIIHNEKDLKHISEKLFQLEFEYIEGELFSIGDSYLINDKTRKTIINFFEKYKSIKHVKLSMFPYLCSLPY